MSVAAFNVEELTTGLTEELFLESPNSIEKILYMDEDFGEWSRLHDVRLGPSHSAQLSVNHTIITTESSMPNRGSIQDAGIYA